MIASLRGRLSAFTSEGVIVEVNGIGYEVILPPIVLQTVEATKQTDEEICLNISAQASRDQPLMTLFGFLNQDEKEFWNLLRSVQRIGNRSAARAMVLPINKIAQAIHEGNRYLLDNLPGVSAQGAERIIATLHGKVQRFALLPEEEVNAPPPAATDEVLKRDSVALLVEMGIRQAAALRSVEQILEAQPDLRRVEDVVTEYFKTP